MSNSIAVVKKDTIDLVSAKVKEFQSKGELYFPENYSPENALKSAWLQLQETVDRDGKLALEVCTKESMANALLSMVIQGLNPDKKQCYFIAYGKKLQMQRSYFGSMAVAKSVNDKIEDIIADVVYEGDTFEYAKQRGKTVITKHVQALGNVKKDKLIAAYCSVFYIDGSEQTTIMTLDEIKAAWKQSKMNPIDDKGNIKAGTTHDKFMSEMMKKTVVNKACKAIINSSDDSNLMAKYAKMSQTDMDDAQLEETIDANANKDVIDVTTIQSTTDEETGEIMDMAETDPTLEDQTGF